MMNFEKVITKMDYMKKVSVSFLHFLNVIKSCNIYYATFYGERWVAMEIIFG